MKAIIPNTQGGFLALPTAGLGDLERLPVIAWEIAADHEGDVLVTPVTPLGTLPDEPRKALWTGHGWIDCECGLAVPGRTVQALLNFWKGSDR